MGPSVFGTFDTKSAKKNDLLLKQVGVIELELGGSVECMLYGFLSTLCIDRLYTQAQVNDF